METAAPARSGHACRTHPVPDAPPSPTPRTTSRSGPRPVGHALLILLILLPPLWGTAATPSGITLAASPVSATTTGRPFGAPSTSLATQHATWMHLPLALRQAVQATLKGIAPHTTPPSDWQQELTAADGVSNDSFGSAVTLSADGQTAFVGAQQKTVVGNDGRDQGAAYVFVHTGSIWTQQQELTAADGADGDEFGSAVALSADGQIALIGAPGKTVGGNLVQGAAYLFVHSGSTWTQQQEIVDPNGANIDWFGSAVALSADGQTALVGDHGKSVGDHGDQGATYVYVRSGGIWTQQQEITASDGAQGDAFGWSVALSADGHTALIGVNYKSVEGISGQGAAYVFVHSGSTWTQQQELTAADGTRVDDFGSAVALSADGHTALIGADGRWVGGQGAAYVFVHSGNTWTQQQVLTATDGRPDDSFGVAVALSADGYTALIGASEGGNNQGTACVFVRSGNTWAQQREIAAANNADLHDLDSAVALSADGHVALIGTGNKGAAYVVGIQRVPLASPTLRIAGVTLRDDLLAARWLPAVQATRPFSVTRAPGGTADGVTRFSAGQADLALRLAPLSAAQRQAERARCAPSTALHLPLALYPVAIAYTLPGLSLPLHLTPTLVSALLSGQITRWNDQRLARLNSGVRLPNLPVVPLRRGDPDRATTLLNLYLAQAHVMPLTSGHTVVMVQRPQTFDVALRQPGAVAVSDLATARQLHVATALLPSVSGTLFAPSTATLPTDPASVAALLTGHEPALVGAPTAYTLSGLIVLDLCRPGSDAQGQALTALVREALGAGQADLTREGYGALPPSVRRAALAILGSTPATPTPSATNTPGATATPTAG